MSALIESDLGRFSKDELRAFIVQAVELTIESVNCIAKGVCEWQGRGYDVSELGLSFSEQYLLIGFGQVLAEAFLRFGHDRKLWRLVSRLPISAQKQLTTYPYRIPVASPDGSNRMVDPLELTARQFHLVFDASDARIRSPAEQRSIIEDETKGASKVAELHDDFVPSRRGVEVAGKVFLTWKQVEVIHGLRDRYKPRS